MRYVPTALQTHLDGPGTTLAFLLKITTQDGTVFGVTSHDQDITYNDGYGALTYSASIGADTSAVENSSGMEIDNAEATMLLAGSGPFTEAQIEAGALDYARFVLYRVNWADLSMGHIIWQTGTTGIVKPHDNLAGVVELRGLGQRLKQNYVDLYSLTCRAVFGSGSGGTCAEKGKCNYAADLLWQSHTVAAVDADEPDRLFDADSAPAVSGASGNIPMAPGLVKWTSGNNAGHYSEVEAHTDGTVGISLRFATPNEIEVGDAFDIRPDCNKTWDSCKDHFDNVENFRGEHLIPLTDSSQQTPFATWPSFYAPGGLPVESDDEASDGGGGGATTIPSSGDIEVGSASFGLNFPPLASIYGADVNFDAYPLRYGTPITLSGTPSNDGTYSVYSASGNKLTITGAAFTEESASNFTVSY